MYKLYFILCFLFIVVGCNPGTQDSQTEGAKADSTAVTAPETSLLSEEQKEIKTQLESTAEQLSTRLSDLRTEADSTAIDLRAELIGKLKKLEARERQLQQHLNKFENGIEEEDMEALKGRFQKLIENIKADLQATY